MSILIGIFLFIHILCAAVIVGYWVANIRKPTVVPAQFHAALGAIVAGVIMVGLLEMQHSTVDNTKIAVKIIIGIIIAILAFIGQRKTKHDTPVSPALANAVGILAVVNIGVATIWH